MRREKLFHRFSGLAILSVIVLFFLGGLVRVTGSGMGCPDWPKCFGEWVPPTSEAQLPSDYKKVYKEKREKKVNRLVEFLNKVGLKQRANEIQQTTWLMEEHPFSVSKAYTEYINRLMGALTGIFALLATVFSFGYFKTQFWKMGFTIGGLMFVIYNGWLGSLVVDTNLFGGMVTIHFVLAFAALFFFMLGYSHSKPSIASTSQKKWLLAISFALILGLIQLISGTLVREQADILARMGTVISNDNFSVLGNKFALHRITAPLLAITLLYVWFKNRGVSERAVLNKFYLASALLVLLQIVSGTINISNSFPPMAQLLHVVAGSVLISGLLYVSIQEFKAKRI